MGIINRIRGLFKREEREVVVEQEEIEEQEATEFDSYTLMTPEERREFKKKIVKAFDESLQEKVGVTFKDLAVKCAAWYTYNNAPMSGIIRKIKSLKELQEDVSALTGGDIGEAVQKIESVIKLKETMSRMNEKKSKGDVLKLVETIGKIVK